MNGCPSTLTDYAQVRHKSARNPAREGPKMFLFNSNKHQDIAARSLISKMIATNPLPHPYRFESLLIKQLLRIGSRRVPMFRICSSAQGCSTAPSFPYPKSHISRASILRMACSLWVICSISGGMIWLFACELLLSGLLTFWKIYIDQPCLESLSPINKSPFTDRPFAHPLFHLCVISQLSSS
jgi:hypothetical protein